MKKHLKKFHRNTAKISSTNVSVPIKNQAQEAHRCVKNVVTWASGLVEQDLAIWQELEMPDGSKSLALVFPERLWMVDGKVLTLRNS